VADAIAALHGGNLTPFHLSIGLHCFEGEAWDRAVFHLRRAGASALERYAKRDAVACFERALSALGRMPRDRSTMEQGFDLRLEMRPALNQLGEIRQVLKYLGEAEALAEQLDDDRRRSRVAAFMTVAQTLLGHLDEAAASGTRAREIALRLGDLKLRLVATASWRKPRYRGEYERVIELATDNLAVLPAEWVNESFGRFAPTSIYDRVFLVRSLAEIGKFDEAERYADQAIRLAEPMQHAYSIGLSQWTASVAHLLQGNWSHVRSRVEQAIAAFRTADAVLAMPLAVAHAAWALARLGELSDARDRLLEAERASWKASRRETSSARLPRAITRSVTRACSWIDSTRLRRWPTRPSSLQGVSPAKRPMRSTCTGTSPAIPTDGTPSARTPTTERRWLEPSLAACARSSHTGISASAASIGASAAMSMLANILRWLPCSTATCACHSGGSRPSRNSTR
jgi:tetratricopeptide (TPR) repeat protein